MIDSKSQKKETILQLLCHELSTSSWIDRFGRIVKGKKAMQQIMIWLHDIIQYDNDFNEDNGKSDIYQFFQFISDVINSNTGNLLNHFVYNDETDLHLPIPVYSYIRPDMGTQFILHIFLSLCRFSTEIDLLQHTTVRNSFLYTKLLGRHNDVFFSRTIIKQFFTKFIEEQLIYFPNSRSLIKGWITTTGKLFNEVIKEIIIPITEMPSV